ncbi:hypothetical protein B8W73_00210 [Arthrobacter agilis]|nr:hypothetical protein B8W73_00210 [Arthrobacter agilis]
MSDVVIQQGVEVPMSDGVILRADVYRPTAPGSYPVLLHRTPYNRQFMQWILPHLDILSAVRRGYVVVVQDTRGSHGSDGEWSPWTFERQDGHDTVVWASRLPDSNGKVGMFGGSYPGQTQWAAAIAQPPGLAAISPQITWSDPRDGHMFRGGAVELALNSFWGLTQSLAHLSKVVVDAEESSVAAAALIRDIEELHGDGNRALPVAPLATLERFGLPDNGVARALRNPATTDDALVAGRYERVKVPSLNIGGWFDLFLQGTLDNYVGMRDQGMPSQLVVGPWTHDIGGGWGREGDVYFGVMSTIPPGAENSTQYQLDWFDRYLPDNPTPRNSDAPVQLFVMGINQWRDEQEWPLQRTVATPLYLQSDGGASFEEPTGEQSHSNYVYDPVDPVPTLGGNHFTPRFRVGPVDQAPVESRSDVLVFTTTPLAEDLEITGRVTARLFAATDGPTTDWVVKLCDVDENGRSLNIVDGIVRTTSEAGQTEEVDIDLWSTSIVIKARHRLRIHVTSSNFPRWDRNPNTEAEALDESTFRAARQTIHHDAARPSHILLPVIPA